MGITQKSRYDGLGNPLNYGGYFDGRSHPLSTRYSSLKGARAYYPFAGSLTDEFDRCATQKAVDSLTTIDSVATPPLELPTGVGYFDYPVNLGAKRIRVVGRGAVATVLKATKQTPFFTSYPDTVPTPVLVAGHGSFVNAIKFAGTTISSDGYWNLSDTGMLDALSIAAGFTVECWTKLDALPGEYDLRDWFASQGAFDGSTNYRYNSIQPQFLTISGVLKIRLFSMNNGQQDYSDLAISNVNTGEWHHYAVTRQDTVIKLWVDGTLVGTRNTTSGTQVRKPWEDFTLGGTPYGGWPEGFPVQKTINGAVCGLRVSNNVRYTTTFTPPTSYTTDSHTLCILDLDNVSGLVARVTNGLQNPNDGYIIWRQGDYAGDVSGTGLVGVGFNGGTFGLYTYGAHNSKFDDVASYLTRYPLYLKGHSFRNTVRNTLFDQPRIGLVASQISICEIYDTEITSPKAFGIVGKESNLKVADAFLYGGGAGNVLSVESPVVLDNVFTTDEAQSTATPFGALIAVGSQTMTVLNSFLYHVLSKNNILTMHGCSGGSVKDSTIYSHPAATEFLTFTGNAPKRKVIKENVGLFSTDVNTTPPFSNQSGYVNNLDTIP